MTITVEKAQLNNQSTLENFGLVEELDAQSAEIISGGWCGGYHPPIWCGGYHPPIWVGGHYPPTWGGGYHPPIWGGGHNPLFGYHGNDNIQGNEAQAS